MALIFPLFGRGLAGGPGGWAAELVAGLARRCDVEVLTTCARDPASWRDYWDPGASEVEGVRVRRFRVDAPRSPALAERLREVALSPASAPEIERRWIEEEGPYSSALLRHLDERRSGREAFVFFDLATATTAFGLPRVASRSVLVPLVGDDARADVASLREVVALSSGAVFATAAERDRLQRDLAPSAPQVVAAHPHEPHEPGAPGEADAARLEAAYLDVIRSVLAQADRAAGA